jgi:hypothetical protein
LNLKQEDTDVGQKRSIFTEFSYEGISLGDGQIKTENLFEYEMLYKVTLHIITDSSVLNL